MKKILIIGANGYIGSRLCRFFLRENYKVTALSHTENVFIPQNTVAFESIKGDIRDTQLVNKLAESGFDVLIDLVSLDHHKSNGEPVFVSSVNLVPTWSLLDAFSKTGLKHFIYFSTVQVYGKLSVGLVKETNHTNYVNAYGLTHSLSENICEYYNRNSSTACTVLRLSNSYGSPTSLNVGCWSLVINDLCKSAYINKSIKLMSDGTPLRDFIHGSDICDAVELLINVGYDNLKKEIYNLCSNTTFTIMELAEKVKNIYYKRYNKHIVIETPSGNMKNELEHYIKQERYLIANDKLKGIGFKQKVSLDNGINDLFDYLERNYEQVS